MVKSVEEDYILYEWIGGPNRTLAVYLENSGEIHYNCYDPELDELQENIQVSSNADIKELLARIFWVMHGNL